MNPQIKELLTKIAIKELNIPTLEKRMDDSLDFHDCGVGSIDV